MPLPPSPIPERMQITRWQCVDRSSLDSCTLNASDRNHHYFTRRKFALSLPSLFLPSRMSQGIWEIFVFVFRVVFSFPSCLSDITVK